MCRNAENGEDMWNHDQATVIGRLWLRQFWPCCCCCCCYDEPVRQLPIWGGQRCPKEMRNSTRLWIRRDPSLPHDSWQPFIDWGTTQGRLSLPTADVLSTIVKHFDLEFLTSQKSTMKFGTDAEITTSVMNKQLNQPTYKQTQIVTSSRKKFITTNK